MRPDLAAAILNISRGRKSHVRRAFPKIYSVRSQRRDCCPFLPHGSTLGPATEIGNVCMDTGVVTVISANDTGGPYVLWGDAKRVHTEVSTALDIRQPIGKQHQGTALRRSLTAHYVAKLHPPGGRSKPKRKGGWSRRRQRQDLAATILGVGRRRKTGTAEGFENISAPRGPSEMATVTCHPSFNTHYRSACLV
jgi:hypothetical protein